MLTASEHIHRYPRRIELLVELLSTAAVLAATLVLGRQMLSVIWQLAPADLRLVGRMEGGRELLFQLFGIPPRCCGDPVVVLQSLLPPLAAFAISLLALLLLRHSFSTVRTSARGILVEFAGDWLPVPWESITAIKVTEAGERYVLLIEANNRYLTGWHRCYSLIYRLGFRRAFLVTSAIGDFDALVKTLLAETDRVARVLSGTGGARLEEEASSPFFRLLLNPAAFFSERPAPPPARPGEAGAAPDETTPGVYPTQISLLLRWGALLLAALVLLRYFSLVLGALAGLIPALQPYPPFTWVLPASISDPLRALLAAHLALLIGGVIVAGLRYLLPDLVARREGLGVRYLRRWHIIPWERISAVKVTELSETSQIVLIQARAPLPLPARFASALYHGSWRPGVLVTSALSTFEALLKRTILEVMGGPTGGQRSQAPVFQSDARSDLLLLLFTPTQALDRLVEEARADDQTKRPTQAMLRRPALTMAALATLPPLVLLADRVVAQGQIPDARLLIAAVGLLLLGVLEWPIVALASIAFDESTGGGEEGGRAWLLYPTSQLPRALALVGVLTLVVLGTPVLPVLAWFGALVWVFVLAAGLWGALYDWRGGLLLSGGLLPVLVQLVLLIAYLFVR